MWEFILVEGLDCIHLVPKSSVALISKVHHLGFDGESEADFMSMLLDAPLTPRASKPALAKEKKVILKPVGLMTKSVYNFIYRPTKLHGLLWNTGKATLKAGYMTRAPGIKVPTMRPNALKTRFNDTAEMERVWHSAILDIHRVKVLRKVVEGVTLNDVSLAICAAALRRYLLEKGELPDQPPVAMVPLSTRTAEEKNIMGNQVSAMYVQLASDVDDQIKRSEKIQIDTTVGNLYQDAIDAKSLMGYAELIPFVLAGVAARFYSSKAIAKRHNLLFKVVITHVPSPQIPLYIASHKLVVNMGTAPIFDKMGLSMPICSYNGTLSISPTSSVNLIPNLDVFTRYIRESAIELELAIQ